MNTRRNKRNLPPEPNILNEQEPDKRDASTNTDEQLKESFEEQTSEIGQAPIFNIHVHMPANNDTNTTKVYLPRIQPIIHMHFDELSKKLRNKTQQQERGLQETDLQSVVIHTMPKFGNIKFHYKNNSCNMYYNKNEKNNCNQEQTLRERNSSIELESNRSDLIETMQSHNSESTCHSENNNGHNKKTQGKTGDEVSNVMISNGQPIKLKRAIVVLKDVCRSSSYKSGAISDSFNHKENKSADNSPSSLLNRITNSNPQIKLEHTFSLGAHTRHVREKPYAGSNNSYANPFSINNCSGSVNFEFPGERNSNKRGSLALLAEGCNFSEILKKFRVKPRTCADDGNLEKPDNSAEAQSVMEDDKRLIDDNVWLTQNSVQIKEEASWIDQSHDTEEKKQEKQEDNNDRVNLQDETSMDGIVSYEIENEPSPNSHEINIRHDNTEISELNIPASPSVEENINGVDPVSRDCEIECSINQFHVSEIESDDYEITTRNKLSSDVVEDLEIVEFDLSNDTSDIDIKSEFVLVETNDLVLADKEDNCYDLKLIKEEMVSPKKGTNEMIQYEKRKSRPQDTPEKEFSPKKIKQAPGTPKKSVTKAPARSTGGEGYIPINTSGPTEFAVAALSSVQACKAHDAKSFKKNMLFGKRVNRFSNPDHLRMYKLKKQASGKKVNEEPS